SDWSTAADNWSTMAYGYGSSSGPQVPWVNGANAVIADAASTTTIYIADDTIQAGSIDFQDENGLALASGPSNGTLSLGSSGMTIQVDSGAVTVSAAIVGP